MANWSEGSLHVNDITIHYHRTGSDNMQSLLLLHGFTDNGLCWSRIAHDLEGTYDVIMPDARGHGRSDGPTTGFSTQILIDDTAGVIRALNLHKPVLFGHSMGARTAAGLAATSLDLVRAIVLEDPPLVNRSVLQLPTEAQRRWQWVLDLQKLSREERITRGFAMNPTWVEEEIIPWADSKAEFDPDVLWKRSDASGDIPWHVVFSRIECPLLLITGDPELGAIVTPDVALEATQLWRHGEVVHISGAGHCIHRDRYDETMAAVRAFLNSVE